MITGVKCRCRQGEQTSKHSGVLSAYRSDDIGLCLRLVCIWYLGILHLDCLRRLWWRRHRSQTDWGSSRIGSRFAVDSVADRPDCQLAQESPWFCCQNTHLGSHRTRWRTWLLPSSHRPRRCVLGRHSPIGRFGAACAVRMELPTTRVGRVVARPTLRLGPRCALAHPTPGPSTPAYAPAARPGTPAGYLPSSSAPPPGSAGRSRAGSA